MRNATQQDVEEAQRTGVMREDVMYVVHGELVHGKRCLSSYEHKVRHDYLRVCPKGDAVVAETWDGLLFVVSLSNLRPVPAKTNPAQKPKKEKRKPVKGTHPWPAYNPDTIKVGDKVRLRNGDVVTVIDFLIDLICLKDDNLKFNRLWVYRSSGRVLKCGKHKWDIVGMHVEEPEQTFCIGDGLLAVDNNGNKCYGVLLQVGYSEVCFFSTSYYFMNRWTDPVEVSRPDAITKDELSKILDNLKFVRKVKYEIKFKD